MSRENNIEKLISIDEFIARAKRFGINFGNGDPKNRLRYYVKIGLLPNAQRKSFNGSAPTGAYPEKTLDRLLRIDKKLKDGKTIQEIKREEVEDFSENFNNNDSLRIINPLKEENFSNQEEYFSQEKLSQKNKFFNKAPLLLKSILFFLAFILAFIFLNSKINFTSHASYFLANLAGSQRFAQLPFSLDENFGHETLRLTRIEPFLTINAETAINAPLKVNNKITSPSFVLIRDEIEGIITVAGLTDQREYSFPDASGTVCLTTGNCIGLSGEVFSSGGVTNRLAKFISGQAVANSSILDLYPGGVAINIDALGNIGIGTLNPRGRLDLFGDFFINGDIISSGMITSNMIGIGITDPEYTLHVDGVIYATGDICTDLAGGRCLSTLPIGGGGGTRGIAGSGTAGYFSIWSTETSLANSILYQTGGNIGIGTTSPGQRLDVDGIIRMTGFQMPTGANSGYVLTTDEFGFGTWQALSGGVLPSGSSGQTLRHNGTTWLADSFLYNTGSAIGVGTSSLSAVFNVSGSSLFHGPLTIQDTSPLGQLILRHNNENHLSFIINSSQAELSASSTIIINSLSGEVRLGSGVTLFNAASSTVSAATFVAEDATVRSSGEMIFRGASSIFRYPVVSQTASINYHRISKKFEDFSGIFPEPLTGTTRRYAFLINSSDDILITNFSEWRVYRENASEEYLTFSLPGLNLVSLEEGQPRMGSFITLPLTDWQLEVRVPSGNSIRVFNIMLLAYDQVD